MEEDVDRSIYIVALIAMIVTINVVLTTVTWICYNGLATLIDINPITMFEAFIFVIVFLVLDWSKQLLFELFFGKQEGTSI